MHIYVIRVVFRKGLCGKAEDGGGGGVHDANQLIQAEKKTDGY